MGEVSKPIMGAQLDFDLDMNQWDDIEEEGEFAWSGPDGRPLVEPDLEEPDISPVGFQSDEIDLPPERVRFATLVNIKAVGEQAYFEGVIVNLSTEGVACVCAAPLEKGKRVWITFRLGLIDDPISLLCEVVWERLPETGEPSYGLRFLELGAPEKKRIEDVVKERSEGRAAEWPLPVMPGIGAVQKLRVSPWLSGTLGLVMGLGIAFVTSSIPLPELTAASLPGQLFTKTAPVTPAKKVEETKKEKPVAALIAETRQAQKKKVKKASRKTVKKSTNERFEGGTTEITITKKTPKLKRVSNVKGLAAPASSKTNSEPLKPLVNYSTRLDGESIIPLAKSKELMLDLRTEKPVSKYKTFWLSSPRRIVVDVPENWSNFDRLNYNVEHALAMKVRVGQYKDKVRFVVETAENATGEPVIKNGQLMVELKGR